MQLHGTLHASLNALPLACLLEFGQRNFMPSTDEIT